MEKIKYRNHWFWKHEVMVKIPKHKVDIKPKWKEMPDKKSMPAARGGFRPLRLVINLKLAHAHPPGGVVTKFGSEIIIRVRYYQADLDAAAKAGGELALGYWDGAKWNRFTAAHHFGLVEWKPKLGKGWAEIKVTGLIDPPIALGS